MSRIQIDLPADRTRLGELRLYSTDMNLICRFACFGKADNDNAIAAGNPKRSPTRKEGDTPTGMYKVTAIRPLPNTQANLRSYGPHPVIAIEGTAGDALGAAQNGRAGLLIHGGAPSTTGGLRPTHGCVRVSDATMAALHSAFADHGAVTAVSIDEI